MDQARVRRLPAGTVLGLRPIEGQLPPGLSDQAATGMLREALRQSAWLDIAAGPVAGKAEVDVRCRFDVTRAAATIELVDAHAATTVATAASTGRPWHVVLDELAWRTRLALGDPVATPPMPLARIYTANADAAAAVESALADAQIGHFGTARQRLLGARRLDGGSAFLLEAMASNASMLGEAANARTLAEEALGYEERRGPTTTHRLLRTLLLCRASSEPQQAGGYDRELTTLAEVGQRERPHDPEVEFTACLASNFRGDFAAAQARLARLAERLPDHAGVHYHLGWAALGNGEPRLARAAFDRCAASLPLQTTVVPRALARFADRDPGLRAFLADIADDPRVRAGTALHEIRRMQAAHELLAGDHAAAAAHMLADLEWLAAHPDMLELSAGDLADAGWILVRLGHGERLGALLPRLQQPRPDSLVADAATFAHGLLESKRTRDRAATVEGALQRRGRACWSEALAAFGHRQRGELGAEQEALGKATQASASPLWKAALIENLRALGRTADADALQAAIRRELAVIDLRRRCQSPLLGPEFACAWLGGVPAVNR